MSNKKFCTTCNNFDLDRGIFISVEGGDGSGKSTQLSNIKEYLDSRGYDSLFLREPGGTSIGEKIRDILLDCDNSEMSGMTEALLYAASRAQIVNEVIIPALSEGKIVVCDRFVDSSIAYQGYGRQMGECIMEINKFAVGECMPDYTLFLDISPEDAAERIETRNEAKDRMELETESFHTRVYEGYISLLNSEFARDRFIRIDASNPPDIVKSDIFDALDRVLK